jgi:hypothetical protein
MVGKSWIQKPGRGAVMVAWTFFFGMGLFAAGCTAMQERLGLIDRPGTATAEALIVAQRLQQTQEVEDQKATDAAATEQAAITATRAVQLTEIAYQEATATAIFGATQTAAIQQTQEVQKTATQQAAGFLPLVQDLVKKGMLTTDQGTYHALEEYTGQQNKPDYMTIRSTGQSPQSFVIRANVDYSSAGNARDWARSACGFMFWRKDAMNYYQAYLGLDGNVYADAVKDNKFIGLGKGYYGLPPRPSGSYQVTLVGSPKGFTVFYNDKPIKTVRAVDGSVTEGTLNFTVVSSYPGDYGMRCKFSDIEIWTAQE